MVISLFKLIVKVKYNILNGSQDTQKSNQFKGWHYKNYKLFYLNIFNSVIHFDNKFKL